MTACRARDLPLRVFRTNGSDKLHSLIVCEVTQVAIDEHEVHTRLHQHRSLVRLTQPLKVGDGLRNSERRREEGHQTSDQRGGSSGAMDQELSDFTQLNAV